MTPENTNINKMPNRWIVALTGTVLMVILGTVYAWSFFQKPIVDTYGWSNSAVAWAFSINIFCLGLAAAWGGINLPKYGPSKLAVTGAVMYGAGFVLGAIAFYVQSLTVLIFGFGVVGGAGVGLGYVTPVVTAAKWFPDKKGFVTGMIVMGFGFGALLMSKVIAPVVMGFTDDNLIYTFLYIGIILIISGFVSAVFIKPPPSDYVSEGHNPSVEHLQTYCADITPRQAVLTIKFLFMWLLLFINVTAGIMFIGFQSPLMQELMGKYNSILDSAALAGTGATLIAVSSLFNGIGRFFWGGLSDKIGRVQVFRLIFGTQFIVFIILLFVTNPYIFAVLVCYVLLCYGGGFGTMPSFVLDVFTKKLMSVVYGAILTAWSFGGIAGPQIVAVMKDRFPENASLYSFSIGAALLGTGFLISLFLNNKPIAE